MGGGPMGGGPMGGGRGGRAGREYPRRTPNLEGLAATPKRLTIDQNPEQIVVTDDEGHSHTYYLDGKKHKVLNAGGETTSIKTRWEGSRLAAESKLDGSGKLTESYELAPDGKQLDVTLRLEDSSLGTPLVIRRVYDAAHANPE